MIVKFVVLLLLFKASNIRCQDDDVEDMKKKIPGSVAYNCETNATTKEYVCTEPKRRCKEKCSDNVSCCPEGTCCQSTDAVKNVTDETTNYIRDYSLMSIGGAMIVLISILAGFKKFWKGKDKRRRRN